MIPVIAIGFLFTRALAFFGVSEFSAQISVAWMNSAAFLKASINVVSFCSAKENLKHSLFKPFRKEVYATPSSRSGIRIASWWKRLTNSDRDSCYPCLIFEKCILVLLSFRLVMNWLTNLSARF